MGFNYLETELIEFLKLFFNRTTDNFDEGEDAGNIQIVQVTLLRFLACLGQLEPVGYDMIELVEKCPENADSFFKLLKKYMIVSGIR